MGSMRGHILGSILRLTTRSIDETRIVDQRDNIDAFFSKWVKAPKFCQVEQQYIDGRYAEWITSTRSHPNKIILYLHGGAYQYGSAATHRAMVGRIGHASHATVLLPEYRLAPEHPFPAALEDACHTYEWLLTKGFAPSDIIIAGDSAGAALSISTTIVMRDKGQPLPAALVCISPWVNLTSKGASYIINQQEDPVLKMSGVTSAADTYTKQEPKDYPLLSPIFADLSHLPPMLIQSGSYELILSDAKKLAERAQDSGVDVTFQQWPGMWHVWHLIGPFLPESTQAIKKIGQFIRERLGSEENYE